MNCTIYLKPGILPDDRGNNEGHSAYKLNNLIIRSLKKVAPRPFYRIVQDGPCLVIVCRTAANVAKIAKLFKTSPLLAAYDVLGKTAAVELVPTAGQQICNGYKCFHFIVRQPEK